MLWLFFLLLLQTVQTIAHGHSHYKIPSLSALSLVSFCRCQNLEYFDEDEIHELALKLRYLGSQTSSSFRHVLSIVDKDYARYVHRIRAARVGKDNLATFIEKITKQHVWEYIANPRPDDVIRAMQNAHRLGGERFNNEAFGNDIVRQEYFKTALIALETYFLTLYVYKEYSIFPYSTLNDSIPVCLEVLEGFIATKMTEFDIGATFPDTVLCLSFLQYLKYVALADSQWDSAMDASQQFNAAVSALKKMRFNPLRTWKYEEPKLRLCIMPQARRGARPVPVSIHLLEDYTRMAQISILDVSDPNDPEQVIKEMKKLEIVMFS